MSTKASQQSRKASSKRSNEEIHIYAIRTVGIYIKRIKRRLR